MRLPILSVREGRFRHWHVGRLFDAADARGIRYWHVRPRHWGYQLMPRATPDYW